jgi:hypothetical protein
MRRGQSPVNGLPLTVAKNRRSHAAAMDCILHRRRGIVWIPERFKVAGMLIEAYSRRVFPVGAVTAAAPGDQIETDVSRYRDVIPFRDGGPLRGGLIDGSDAVMSRIPAGLRRDGRI